jgi:hypothetical protein
MSKMNKKNKMNNGSIFKGRLENDVEMLVLLMFRDGRGRGEFIDLNFNTVADPMGGPPVTEVTFKLCRNDGRDTYDSEWVRQRLVELYKSGFLFEGYFEDGYPVEVDVFCESVKLLQNYDGALDCHFWKKW